jgi:hypothetical protein
MDLAVILSSFGALTGAWGYYTSGVSKTSRRVGRKLPAKAPVLQRADWIQDLVRENAANAQAIPSLNGPYMQQLMAEAKSYDYALKSRKSLDGSMADLTSAAGSGSDSGSSALAPGSESAGEDRALAPISGVGAKKIQELLGFAGEKPTPDECDAKKADICERDVNAIFETLTEAGLTEVPHATAMEVIKRIKGVCCGRQGSQEANPEEIEKFKTMVSTRSKQLLEKLKELQQ